MGPTVPASVATSASPRRGRRQACDIPAGAGDTKGRRALPCRGRSVPVRRRSYRSGQFPEGSTVSWAAWCRIAAGPRCLAVLLACRPRDRLRCRSGLGVDCRAGRDTNDRVRRPARARRARLGRPGAAPVGGGPAVRRGCRRRSGARGRGAPRSVRRGLRGRAPPTCGSRAPGRWPAATSVRFQQTRAGLPVFGGQLVTVLNASRRAAVGVRRDRPRAAERTGVPRGGVDRALHRQSAPWRPRPAWTTDALRRRPADALAAGPVAARPDRSGDPAAGVAGAGHASAGRPDVRRRSCSSTPAPAGSRCA